MADKDIDVSDYFETIIKHSANVLEYEVKSAMAAVDHDCLARGTNRTTEHIFALERVATSAIINECKKAISELFNFVNAEYIPIKNSDLESIKALLNKNIQESAAKISISPEKYLGSGSNIHLKKLDTLKTSGADEYLLSYVDMKYSESKLNKKSIILKQSNRNLWFGIISLFISLAALAVSIWG
ncbi:MAG: hypothetical protein EOM54_10305 [Clostridia bacterium]|nr:hypothetical protein [Clostridia bacterium]